MTAQQIDDDVFDANGLLKDGRVLRIGMMMADGLSDVQRAIAMTQQALGDGGSYSFTSDARARLEDVYRQREIEDGNAWRGPGQTPMKHDTTLSLDEIYRQRELEDSNAWRGPNHNVTQPVARQMTRDEANAERERAYRDYDEAAANAWRGSPNNVGGDR